MKLLIVPLVVKNESLNSFLMRICQENSYPSVSWLFNILGFKDSNLTTNNINDLFKPLSDLTGFDEEIFHIFNHEYYLSECNKESFVINYKGIFMDTLKICPVCYKENRILMKTWELNFNIACSIHGCLLINRCNKCLKPISIRRKDIRKCNCGNPLSELPFVRIEENEWMFSMLVEHIFSEEKIHIKSLGTFNNPNLINLTKGQFIFLVCQFVSKIHYDYYKINLSFKSSTLDQKFRISLQRFYGIFSDWPRSFHEFLMEYKDINKEINRESGVKKYFGYFVPMIYKKLNPDVFDFIRKEFENFIYNNWELGYEWAIKNNIKSVYISAFEVQKKYKIFLETLKRLIIDEHINGLIIPSGSMEKVQVDEQSLQKHLIDLEQFSSVSDARKLLGLGLKAVTTLINTNYLSTSSEYQAVYNKIFIRNKDIYLILGMFRKKSKLVNDLTSSMISWEELLSKYTYRELSLRDIFGLIEEEKLTPYLKSYKVGQNNKLNDYIFIENEIISLIKGTNRSLYSIRRISAILHVSSVSIANWIANGYLKIYKEDKKMRTTYIKAEDFAEFQKKYITLSELLLKYREYSKETLLEVLSQNGIEPLTTSKRGVGLGALFDRAVFVDLNHLIKRNLLGD